MRNTEDYFTHPQEIWDEKKCAKVSKYRGTNAYGTKYPYRGKVASSASTSAEYGQTKGYNGGFTAPDGKWYKGEIKPLPQIPDNYEFYKIVSWGTFLRKRGI